MMNKTLKVLIILGFSLLAGCGSSFVMPDPYYNPKLAKYVDLFKTDAAARGKKLDNIDLRVVQYVPKGYSSYGRTIADNEVGICAMFNLEDDLILGAGRRWYEIWIDQEYPFSEAKLKLTMYHELGHCFLQKIHAPTGIMAPIIYMSDTYIENNWGPLVDELFY